VCGVCVELCCVCGWVCVRGVCVVCVSVCVVWMCVFCV